MKHEDKRKPIEKRIEKKAEEKAEEKKEAQEENKKEDKVASFLRPTKSSQNRNQMENKSAIIDLKSSKIEEQPMSKSQVRRQNIESHKRTNAGLPLK